MKKNLLTLMFVIAFICVGVSVASAKNASSLGNSVAVSKKLSPAKTISNKIKALEAICNGMVPCAAQLDWLLQVNQIYEFDCAAGGFQVGCSPDAERDLIEAANIYELCLWWNGHMKNIDKTKDRNKKLDPNG